MVSSVTVPHTYNANTHLIETPHTQTFRIEHIISCTIIVWPRYENASAGAEQQHTAAAMTDLRTAGWFLCRLPAQMQCSDLHERVSVASTAQTSQTTTQTAAHFRIRSSFEPISISRKRDYFRCQRMHTVHSK